MNLFIPPLGTEIVLAEAWTFKLHSEYRNFGAFEHFNLLKKNQTESWDLWRSNDEHDVTLPTGTVLKIDRIYIRKGNKDFDSVTFFMKGVKKKVRFWAKLADVNRIIIFGAPYHSKDLQPKVNLPPGWPEGLTYGSEASDT